MPGIVDIHRLGATADKAKVLCIFVHGRNQMPEDMEAAVIRRLSTPDVAFALPRAGDKCWYNALAVNPLTPDTQAELGASCADLVALARRLRADAPGRPLVIAGFSQGACLSVEQAFGGQEPPDALVALTGCRVGVPTDARPSLLPGGLPVYLSAGSADPWIPLSAFAEAVIALGQGGAALRSDVFANRAHEVCGPEIAMLDSVLADLAAGRAPGFGVAR
jgi:phospholipase/carboxylesterase